jgi:hypothetical protein
MKKQIPAKYLTKTFDSKADKIRQFFVNDDDSIILTEHEKELRERFEKAFSLLCNYHSNEQAVTVMMKHYGYSRAQAYRDIRNATDIFGDVLQSKKEASKHILSEMAMKNYQLAASRNDLDNMNKAVANLIKIAGVDRDEFDLPDPSKIQPPTQILQISMDFLSSGFAQVIDDKAKEELNNLTKKINDLIDKSPVSQYLNKLNMIQDVEFTEVNDEA